MKLEPFIIQMATNAQTIQQLIAGVSDEQARWKPDAESWSILEVVNHLYDEEREDFRVRLDIILHRPDDDWPPIDPLGWVTSRRYNGRDLRQSINNFMNEREKSLAWLRGLDKPDMDAAVEDPRGRMRAGDMFAAWVAHDLLHIRQLVEVGWAWTTRELAPYDPGYAGEW